MNVFFKKLPILLHPKGLERVSVWPLFLIGSCVHRKEPSSSMKSGNFVTSCATIRFSQRSLLQGVSLSFSCTLTYNVAGNI